MLEKPLARNDSGNTEKMDRGAHKKVKRLQQNDLTPNTAEGGHVKIKEWMLRLNHLPAVRQIQRKRAMWDIDCINLSGEHSRKLEKKSCLLTE